MTIMTVQTVHIPSFMYEIRQYSAVVFVVLLLVMIGTLSWRRHLQCSKLPLGFLSEEYPSKSVEPS